MSRARAGASSSRLRFARAPPASRRDERGAHFGQRISLAEAPNESLDPDRLAPRSDRRWVGTGRAAVAALSRPSVPRGVITCARRRAAHTACGIASPIASPASPMLFGLPGKLMISVRPRMPATARESIQFCVCSRDAARSASAMPGSLTLDHCAGCLGRDVVGRESGAARGQDESHSLRVATSGAAPISILLCSSGTISVAATSAPISRANRPARARPRPLPAVASGRADRDDRGPHCLRDKVTRRVSSRSCPRSSRAA